jgi:hypothetical protein
MVKERSIERAIRKTLEEGSGSSVQNCPDENRLAAYMEHRLSAPEKAALEQHASNCLRCQQVMAHAMTLSDRAEQGSERPNSLDSRPLIPAGLLRPFPALAGILVALVAGTLLYRFYMEPSALPEPGPSSVVRRSVADQEEKSRSDQDKVVEMTEPIKRAEAEEALPAVSDTIQEAAAAREELEKPADLETAQSKNEVLRAAAPPGEEKKQAVATTATDRNAGAARLAVGGIRKPESRTALRQKLTDEASRTPNQAIAALKSRLSSFEHGLSPRRMGDRSFYRTEGFWIDSQCLEHIGTAVAEIEPESAAMSQILTAIPELAELGQTGIPIIIFWDNENCLIR